VVALYATLATVSNDHCASCTAGAGEPEGVADGDTVAGVADDDGVAVSVDTVFVGAAEGVLEPVLDAV